MRRWYAVALGLAAVAALAVAPVREQPAVHAQAGQAWQVMAGPDIEDDFIGMNAFFPKALTVNAGDTVNFVLAGFHTVTFNAGQPDLALFVPGDAAGELKGGPALFPFPPGPTPPSGAYDGTTQISSGTPQGEESPPFSLTFTRSGVYAYVCAIHPGMEGSVTVLPAGAGLPETPAQATARGQADYNGLADDMREQIRGIQGARVPSSGGATVQTVTAGINYPSGASYLNFAPSSVTISRGGTVVWNMSDSFEVHTVTFLSGEETPEFIEPQGEPGAGPPTLVVPAKIAQTVGGSTYSGTGYFNSGILAVGDAYALTFDTAGTYRYLCLVHPFMMGTVTVTE